MNQEDAKSAAQLGIALDLAGLVSDVRAERVEHLPQNSVFLLALVVLASRFDETELAELLSVPDEVVEGAARHTHSQVRGELILRNLNDVIDKARNTKENE